MTETAKAEDRWGAPLAISARDLFLGFFKIGALGFGGVAPARGG